MESFRERYIQDKKKLKKKWKMFYCMPDDDIVNSEFEILNRNADIMSEFENVQLFRSVKQIRSGNHVITCKLNKISLSLPECYGWRPKRKTYPTSIVTQTYLKKRQPMALQHLAAVPAVKVLKYQCASILVGVFNAVKGKRFLIRSGSAFARITYDFEHIVKNYIYAKKFDALVSDFYFRDLEEVNSYFTGGRVEVHEPAPFCMECADIFENVKNSLCQCISCQLMLALQFTPGFEYKYHTIFHK